MKGNIMSRFLIAITFTCTAWASISMAQQIEQSDRNNTVVYAKPSPPRYRFDLLRGVGKFPSSDKSTYVILSIDDSDSIIASLLTSKYMHAYMNLLTHQKKQIREIRKNAARKFSEAAEGITTCDHPEFEALKRIVDGISIQMVEDCKDVLLPHQWETFEATRNQEHINHDGGMLASLLEGMLTNSLDEEARTRVRNRKQAVMKMVEEELRKLERRAIEELLINEPEESRSEILGMYSDPVHPYVLPRFNKLLSPVPYPPTIEMSSSGEKMLKKNIGSLGSHRN